jgi:hypothetical protein
MSLVKRRSLIQPTEILAGNVQHVSSRSSGAEISVGAGRRGATSSPVDGSKVKDEAMTFHLTIETISVCCWITIDRRKRSELLSSSATPPLVRHCHRQRLCCIAIWADEFKFRLIRRRWWCGSFLLHVPGLWVPLSDAHAQ